MWTNVDGHFGLSGDAPASDPNKEEVQSVSQRNVPVPRRASYSPASPTRTETNVWAVTNRDGTFPSLLDRCSLAQILIVDDHDVFRKQLRRLVENQSDWAVCAEADNGILAVDQHRKNNPHLTIIDFNMPGLDGLKASREILKEHPDAVVLMVTVFASGQLADEAKRAGIKGFCSKGQVEGIVRAIETLLRGETYFSPDAQPSFPPGTQAGA